MRIAVTGSDRVGAPGRATGLLTAAHPGPAVAVTTITALLAVAARLPVGTGVVVTLAALTGHLPLGWANALLDARRDRQVGRTDKPLATGQVGVGAVAVALGLAGIACVVLSL